MNISTCFVVKKRLELESKFEGCIQATVEYVSTIDDFDELVDPRILARHCLGPKPSHYVSLVLYGEKRKVSWSRMKLFFLPFPLLFIYLFIYF